MIKTACGLDCYDGCAITYENNKISGSKINKMTNGTLCAVLNREFDKAARIKKPMINGNAVSMDEALEYVASKLTKKSLLWRGSGNVGVMQGVTDLLMERVDCSLTHGSLCDGAGHHGIEEGRGLNITLPLEQIEKSEVVVVWGRNITTTNAHILPLIKDKTIIVIDPVRTKIAKMSDLHIQLAPRSDFYLALLLARFSFMEDLIDIDWLKVNAPEFEEYHDFLRGFRIKSLLTLIDTSLNTIGDMLSLIANKKVVFLVGVGVQKYSIGSQVLRAIDSLVAILGLFGKDGCGVSYLGDSKLEYENPFDTKCKKVSKIDTPFDDFDTVLIQGGNPMSSMPNSNQVKSRLSSVNDIIYFGLYHNDTSKIANVIIPALNFYEKDDFRLNYGNQYAHRMNKIKECNYGISEYDFSQNIINILGKAKLEEEQYYLDFFENQCIKDGDHLILRGYYEIPYENGFDGEFNFIDDYDDDFMDTKKIKRPKGYKNIKEEGDLWLITQKMPHTINTQFRSSNTIIISPEHGFNDGELINISSEYGSTSLVVKNSYDIRIDSVVVGSNCTEINQLTPSVISNDGNGACYGEVKVTLSKIVL
jgi:anaerobic selenocysteine-containing dehydrogenase